MGFRSKTIKRLKAEMSQLSGKARTRYYYEVYKPYVKGGRVTQSEARRLVETSQAKALAKDPTLKISKSKLSEDTPTLTEQETKVPVEVKAEPKQEPEQKTLEPEKTKISLDPRVGTLTMAERPKTITEKLRRFAEEKEQQTIKTKGFEKQAAAFAAFGLGGLAEISATLGGIKTLITKPKETSKAIVTAGKKVIAEPGKAITETGAKIGEALRTRPASTLGRAAGGVAIGVGAGKIISKAPTPKVKLETFKLPLAEGETQLFKGVSVELGKKAQPVVGVGKGKLKIGTPAIEEVTKISSKGFTPQTATETRIFRESLKKFLPEEAERLSKAISIAEKTEKVKVKAFKKLTRNIKSLSPEGVEEVIRLAREKKGKVFGSFPTESQLPGARTPGDIDLDLPLGEAETISETKELVKRLRSVGEDVRISKETPTLIEAKVAPGKYVHAVDIKSIDAPSIAGTPTQEKAFGFTLTQKPTKIEDVLATPLSEQGLRKTSATFIFGEKPAAPKGSQIGLFFETEAPTFRPKAHRIKDVPDYFSTQEFLISKKIFGKSKLRKQLTSLKETFPKQIFEDNLAKVKIEIPSSRPSLKPSKTLLSRTFPSARILPSRSPSVRPSPRISPSIMPSITPSPSISPSLKPSPSPSPIISPSIKPSPSLKPSKIPSPKPSPSLKPSPSPSPRISPSISPSPKPGRRFAPVVRPPVITKRSSNVREELIKSQKKVAERLTKFTPSLIALETGQKKKKKKILTGIEIRGIKF